MQPPEKTLNQPGNADLIHHFGELPATDRAHAAAGPGEGRNHWLCAIKHRLFGAAHDRELAIFGTGLPPGSRSIHEMHPLRAGKGIQFSRHLGRGGGVIHQRTSGPHARQGSIIANTTLRRSSSLPTQQNTKSASAAASRGVAADTPPHWRTHCAALAAVRLYTVTWCPARTKWATIG